ncbi:P22 coat - protein 5 family protein [Acinetobacter guillouiae]|uniref:P22 phage major capsid protein family protein n=1 Tax=Acinetobacter guillouiae TaxID=106649 RepID=UPI0021D194E9|nr:P22 phage major capsid protein family protein [Acinetobacter guillouiae]MCU4491291.1 P22 coat - protein 5 family protein [Acinetobacter guillouiae]
MANNLNGLLPTLYTAMDIVSRELTGFIPAVTRDSTIERAAVGDDVKIPVTTVAGAQDTVPGVTAPNAGDGSVDNVVAKITKSRNVPIRWNGEETRSLQNAGTYQTIMADRFAQAMRTLINEVEYDCWLEAYKGAGGAYGVAGSTPFAVAADMTDFSGILGVLESNGAPRNDLQLVLGHSAIGNFRGKQSQLFKVNEAGSADLLRNGMTDRVMSFAIRHSHSIGIHTKGSGADYLVNGAPAIGDKTLTVDGGTGTVLAGDILTFAGDTNKYVSGGLLGANLSLNGGLIIEPADNSVITLGSSYTPNVAFSRSAIALATRAPALPEGGDSADDRTTIVDPLTGLAFEVSVYRQYKQVVYEVALAWGVKAVTKRHIGLLIG